LKKNKTSKNWLNKKHKDVFFKKSKMHGYKSRSAFKLIEMNDKFKFIKNNTNLLDLGASPGSWSQVAGKIINRGKILAVDIKPMEKIKNIHFLKEDINNPQIHEKIISYFGKKIDVIISDMASNTTGNKSLDSYRTGELCLNAMHLSNNLLNQDGVFLSKIFMGSIFTEINKKANEYFKKVVKYKPLSSKKESKEIYIFCEGVKKI
jgi:23S rRNA (uridine2552-2'-O)-methyltransferase